MANESTVLDSRLRSGTLVARHNSGEHDNRLALIRFETSMDIEESALVR